jgi:hypothetical protein
MNKSKFQYVICKLQYCEITGNKNLKYLCWGDNENLSWSEEINDETIIYDSTEGAAYYLKPDQALMVLLKNDQRINGCNWRFHNIRRFK